MKWQGETSNQFRRRLRQEGVKRFALFPTTMDSGEVVWLEYYWVAGYPSLHGGFDHLRRATTREEAVRLANPPRPTAPIDTQQRRET